MKPVHLTPHKLNDEIVIDSIIAINHLKAEGGVKGRIGGGIAV